MQCRYFKQLHSPIATNILDYIRQPVVAEQQCMERTEDCPCPQINIIVNYMSNVQYDFIMTQGFYKDNSIYENNTDKDINRNRCLVDLNETPNKVTVRALIPELERDVLTYVLKKTTCKRD